MSIEGDIQTVFACASRDFESIANAIDHLLAGVETSTNPNSVRGRSEAMLRKVQELRDEADRIVCDMEFSCDDEFDVSDEEIAHMEATEAADPNPLMESYPGERIGNE